MERIYIHAIEGTEYHAPVNAVRLPSGDYQIAEDNYFDFEDFTLLPEFIPEDVVKVERRGPDLYATELVSPSPSPEKKYIDLRRRILLEDLPITQEVIIQYAAEIKRLLKEYPGGEEHGFPTVQQWVDKFRAAFRP
jgi:hypothetical protein